MFIYTVDSPVFSFLMYCGCFQHKYPVRRDPRNVLLQISDLWCCIFCPLKGLYHVMNIFGKAHKIRPVVFV